VTRQSLHNQNELFLQLARGDEHAFTQIFLHYNRRLYPYILKKIKSPELAEEMVQEIFCKLWMHRDYLLGIENPEGYLYRIASNTILDHFRKMVQEYRMMKKLAEQEMPLTEEEEESINFRETRKILQEGIIQLSGQRKLIFTLRQQGLSYEEIAGQLGLSANTVRNHLIAANKFIRNYLVQRGIAPALIIPLANFF
jgi:RNA polymerase sigma-70 factor, Bacteroides expansion family 1